MAAGFSTCTSSHHLGVVSASSAHFGPESAGGEEQEEVVSAEVRNAFVAVEREFDASLASLFNDLDSASSIGGQHFQSAGDEKNQSKSSATVYWRYLCLFVLFLALVFSVTSLGPMGGVQREHVAKKEKSTVIVLEERISALQRHLVATESELKAAKALASTASDALAKSKAKCWMDLADSISRHNHALQSMSGLGKALDRAETETDRHRQHSRNHIIEMSRNQVQQTSYKYRRTRNEVMELEGEIRELHEKLTSKPYVNTTLIMEDVLWLLLCGWLNL